MVRIPVRIVRRTPFGGAWVAAQVPFKRTIWVRPSVDLTARLLAHELRHVIQAERAIWPLAYVIQWARTGFSYHRMSYEREARAAETDARYLAWAEDLIRGSP